MGNRKTKKASTKLKVLARFLWLIALSLTVFFIYELNKINMLPIKYSLILVGVMIVLILIFGKFVWKKKIGRVFLTFINFLLFIYILIFGYVSLKMKDTIGFMEKNLGVRFETNVYYVLVNNDSKYKSIEDIKDKTIYSYKDQDDMSEVEDALNKKVKVNIKYESYVSELLNNLLYDNELVVYVNSGNYDVMVQNNESYASQVRILDTVEIKVEKKIEKTNVNVTEEPFIIFINGIDTRSNSLPSRSLSDVNMLMVVNPKDYKILLVSIPRDYYLTVPGTGTKDKLTHTGTIGGVSKTKETLEEAFGISIPYYIRVNFNFVTNLVDSIDGINIYNDQTYGFTCSSENTCYFEPEWNYSVDGKCALAFARERYTYETGDRHRGENQQHVIDQIFKKITSSKTLITNYSDILNSLNGTFETNISNDNLSSLVKMQLNDMPEWEIDKYSVDGYGAYDYTYSYPNQTLYVMIPDDYSMEEAKTRINNILEKDTN